MLDPVWKLNRSYLDHLRKNPERSSLQLRQLRRFLVARKCTFRGKPMPTLLKPNFISPKQNSILVRNVEKMSVILDKFVRYYLSNHEVREIMKFPEKENELFFIEPGYDNPIVISRLDAFLNEYSVKFLEFNCDSPAGIAYSDVLEEGFNELFREFGFVDKWKIRSMRRQELLLGSLLKCYSQFRSHRPGMPEKPVIAIVDGKDVSTYSEFQLHEDHFRSRGYETLIASPQDFYIKDGRALAGDREVHLIYRRVITRELVSKWEEVPGFIESIREGLVCCCNSFRSYIVGNKKVLSLITNPRFQEIYSRSELRIIRDTIPWTEILSDAKATFEGKQVELKTFVQENRQRLVLKPANMYGGMDVHIVRETKPGTWEEVMNRHIRDESWVVQEYVDIPRDRYPEANHPQRLKNKYVNINPFALLGSYSGSITRISDFPVINVSAGGGLVPTFTAEQKRAV
jgi:uncharacterized circularly permuted ATP-grasp superfamily protein